MKPDFSMIVETSLLGDFETFIEASIENSTSVGILRLMISVTDTPIVNFPPFFEDGPPEP